MAHGNVNSVAPNNSPPRESKRRAAVHTAFYPKYSVSFKTHGYSHFHARALHSHPLRLSFVSLSCRLFFTLVVVHRSLQLFGIRTVIFNTFDTNCRLRVACTERVRLFAILSVFNPKRLKINNIVQFEIKCSETVQ